MAGGSGFKEAAAELYALPPEEFVAARDERARAARAAGDPGLAAELGRLRRPSASAWAVNLLVRDRPELLEQLTALGEDLRRAQEKLQGAALRELAGQRQRVVAELVRLARRSAADAGHPISAQTGYEVEQTLHAALADPAVAREVCAGRLVHSVERAGFGTEDTPTTPSRRTASSRARTTRGTAAAPSGTSDAQRQAAERTARLEAERDAARADLDRAMAEAAHAEEAHAGANQGRDDATALVDSLEVQLNVARHALRDTGRQIGDARRRADAAVRARDAAKRRLADAESKLAAGETTPADRARSR